MDVIEISGFKSGIDRSGVNFLDPSDAFESIENGYVYRQEILSRKGYTQFGTALTGVSDNDRTRVMGIFENYLPDGTRELLVCTKKYLYKYNTGTDAFDLIPFKADILIADANFNFGITGNAQYVSGTTYLNPDGTQRFVFTGSGMVEAPARGEANFSAVFYYDGNEVGDFFNPLDNMTPAVEPAQGRVIRAVKVNTFSGRLNLVIPTIQGSSTRIYQQAVLFSALPDEGGSGDNFNTPGAGLIVANTFQTMLGAVILGDQMILQFQRSSWSLETTGDAFNPYITRQIPSVLGTDAGFSAVEWDYEVKSLGKTGCITTDGRQSLRFDNLIPYFTRSNISQENFNLVYGGFYREQGQFLFSYPSSNDIDYQDKVLVYNYEEHTWSVFDARFSVFGETIVGQSLTWDDIDENIKPSWATWDTTEEIWDEIGIGAQTQKTLAGGNNGDIYHLSQDYDGYFLDITNITNASSAVISIDANPFAIGDLVYIDQVSGMTEINGQTANVTAITSSSITVNINSSSYGTYTMGGIVEQYIKFRAQTTVFNPYRAQGRKCNLSHIEFLLSTETEHMFVDIYEDEEESPFKTVELEPVQGSTKDRQWITVIVNDEANFFTFVFREDIISEQIKIADMRIHCAQGALTAG